MVEGPKMSFEAPYDWVSAVYMSESFFNDDRFKEEKKRFIDKTEIVSDSVFKSMSDTQTPQGVLAIVKMPHYEIDELFKGNKTELLVLESIQRVLWYVQSYEKVFAQRQLAEFGEKRRKELAEKRRELDKAKLRVREIDGVIQKLYEDNATGKISDERFATMSMSLENEQSELKDRIPALENELENAKIKTEGLQRFIDKAKQVTRPNNLTPELVHEFIEKIVVSAPEYKDGKRCQKVEIYYNGVGIVREPTAEEMEEYFQEHISKKPFLKAKTA